VTVKAYCPVSDKIILSCLEDFVKKHKGKPPKKIKAITCETLFGLKGLPRNG
jgi:hypothetical protein